MLKNNSSTGQPETNRPLHNISTILKYNFQIFWDKFKNFLVTAIPARMSMCEVFKKKEKLCSSFKK